MESVILHISTDLMNQTASENVLNRNKMWNKKYRNEKVCCLFDN